MGPFLFDPLGGTVERAQVAYYLDCQLIEHALKVSVEVRGPQHETLAAQVCSLCYDRLGPHLSFLWAFFWMLIELSFDHSSGPVVCLNSSIRF